MIIVIIWKVINGEENLKMKLQGEYNFKDFMDLYFNKYYFNSKQNLANRLILTLGGGILAIQLFLFLFLNNVYTALSTYVDAKLVIFMLLLFGASYFFKPKLIYENYKKNHNPNSYIEVNENELKLHTGKELRFEMARLKNTVVLKRGYFLDFDESFIFYIPHRFFRSTEDLRNFHNLCRKKGA